MTIISTRRGTRSAAGGGSPLSLPLATSSNLSITLRGTWSTPGAFEYGGGGMSIGNGSQIYVGGLDTSQIFGRMSIPSLSGTASTQVTPVTISGGVGPGGSSADDRRITGSLYYNGDLYVGETSYYDTDNAMDKWIKVCSADLSTQGVFSGVTRLKGSTTRMISGPMMHIPALWQDLLGGPAAVLGCHLSIITHSQCGYGFAVFDPATVVSGGTAVTVNDLLGYEYANALEPGGASFPGWAGYPKNANGGTDYFSQVGQPLGTAIIPEGSRTLLFIGTHGYGVADNGCHAGSSVVADPCRLQCVAYDLQDLVDSKNGLVNRYGILPYAWWEFPDQAVLFSACVGDFAGAGTFCYEPTSRRLYGNPDGFHGGNWTMWEWQVGVVS